MTQAQLTLQTATGDVTLTESDGAITRVSWSTGGTDHTPLLDTAAAQMAEYFAGRRQSFDLPLQINASALTQRVCAQMLAIPFGETCTYGDIARALGVPPQAIGQACGANPIPIIIPCHRVLAANGLGGFSGTGGIETKVQLLRHESAAGLLI